MRQIRIIAVVVIFTGHVYSFSSFSRPPPKCHGFSVLIGSHSHVHRYRKSRYRWSWTLKATTSSEGVVQRERAQQSKRKAKEELMNRRMQTLQELLPGLDAYLLVSKSPRLLSADLQNIVPDRLTALKNLLPAVDVLRLVRLNPDLLLYDVRKSLAPRVAALQQLFPESPKLLMRAPSLLYHDTETYLLPKMRQLEGLLPGVDILRLVRREPTVLGLDISRTIKPRLEGLGELLPGQNVTSMVAKIPRLLTSDVSGMAQKVSSLRWLLGPSADLNKILRRKPDLLLSNVETTVAAKFRQLQALFPEGDVVAMAERDATVLFYDFDKSINVKVNCWRERVSNVSELDSLIQAYPVLLSYSLDTSVSRLDFLIQMKSSEMEMDAAKLRQVVQTPRAVWETSHGEEYRKFLESKVEGPSVLRLWPGLYFDSDSINGLGIGAMNTGEKLLEGDGAAVRMQDDGSARVVGPRAAATKSSSAHIKSLEAKYGTTIKEAQLRFSSALREGKYGANPTEMDMILYDIKSFDQQVRKLATGKRLKTFRELIPGLNSDRLFRDYPQVVMMDLKKVQQRVQELRSLLAGSDVAGAVSIAPNLLLNDVQTCLRPRMTRLVVAMSVKQLGGVLDAEKVKAMVVRCPQLLLSDVRNVVVPCLQYMLRSTSDHNELGSRLYRDPSLLLVGVGPLARLQYTLEQHRNGTAPISLVNLGTTLAPPPPVGAEGKAGGSDEPDAFEGTSRRRQDALVAGIGTANTGDGASRDKEDQTRLVPPLVVPQVLKCQLRDFVERNPGYVSFLAQRQGLPEPNSVASEESQVVFWERAVGARLSEIFRPVDSPYARHKMKKLREAAGKGPDGQRATLSELDLLVGDVLYFNHRVGDLRVCRVEGVGGTLAFKIGLRLAERTSSFLTTAMGELFRSKIQAGIPLALDLRLEATRLAKDVEWGSSQIRRLLGLGPLTERDVLTTSTFTPPAQETKANGTWLSEAWGALWKDSGVNGGSGDNKANKAQPEGAGDGETAQVLDNLLRHLLGQLSSDEGRLEGLLDMFVGAEGASLEKETQEDN